MLMCQSWIERKPPKALGDNEKKKLPFLTGRNLVEPGSGRSSHLLQPVEGEKDAHRLHPSIEITPTSQLCYFLKRNQS